jgi:hypothetical protein
VAARAELSFEVIDGWRTVRLWRAGSIVRRFRRSLAK